MRHVQRSILQSIQDNRRNDGSGPILLRGSALFRCRVSLQYEFILVARCQARLGMACGRLAHLVDHTQHVSCSLVKSVDVKTIIQCWFVAHSLYSGTAAYPKVSLQHDRYHFIHCVRRFSRIPQMITDLATEWSKRVVRKRSSRFRS
jgi:hypothetical protein